MLSFLRERAIDLAFVCESHVGLLRRISSLCAEVDGGVEVAQATSALMERERLGSVVSAWDALPHARVGGLTSRSWRSYAPCTLLRLTRAPSPYRSAS